MTPDEWKAAMKNEAASVDDPDWALHTARAVRRLGARNALHSALVFAGLGAAQVFLVQFVWATEPPAQLWLSVMLAVIGAALVLAWREQRILRVAAGSLAYFPGAWLSVLALQHWAPLRALSSPGLEEAGAVVLVVLAVCTAGTCRLVRALRQMRRT